jgi:hypothetical protein
MSSREITPIGDKPGAADVEIQRLADELYLQRVSDARAMSPEEKLLAGEELFNYACSITLAGIRDQFPGLSEEEYRQIFEKRLALRARMERGG